MSDPPVQRPHLEPRDAAWKVRAGDEPPFTWESIPDGQKFTSDTLEGLQEFLDMRAAAHRARELEEQYEDLKRELCKPENVVARENAHLHLRIKRKNDQINAAEATARDLEEQLAAAQTRWRLMLDAREEESNRAERAEEQLEAAEKFKAAMVRANQRQLLVVNAAVAYCSDLNNRGEAKTDDLETAIAALYATKVEGPETYAEAVADSSPASRQEADLNRFLIETSGHKSERDSVHCRYCGAHPMHWARPCGSSPASELNA